MLPFNPSTDFTQAVDGLEPVTYRRRGDSPGGSPTSIAHALRRAVTIHEAAASDGRFTASDVTWHLSAAELPQRPRLGDVLCDAGGSRWTVLAVAPTALGSRWRCTCRSLAIVFALDDTIAILRADRVKGSGGALEATWRVWRTGIRARIQPVETQVGAKDEALQTTARCHIYVEEPLALDPTHRIRAADGTIYRVLGVTLAERIGELPRIEVEVVA